MTQNNTRIRLGWLGGGFAAIVAVLGSLNVQGSEHHFHPGAVYVLTNEASGNRLAVLTRDGQGALAVAGFVSTGGVGSGQNTHSQGGLAFGPNGKTLYAANAGDNSISVFRLRPTGPELVQRVASGGQTPVSLAAHGRLLYVANAGSLNGGVDSIAGFRIVHEGMLEAIAGSSRPLSIPAAGPAQVGFDRGGKVLIVTERNTNMITTYELDHAGVPGEPQPMRSSGAVPFGFRVTDAGVLIVSEAGGAPAGLSAVSSYDVSRKGSLYVISGSVPTEQVAACWIGVTADGAFAYSVNAGSDSITAYAVNEAGELQQIAGGGGIFMTGGTTPTEVGIVGDSLLYVLNRDSGGVSAFTIGEEGALEMFQDLSAILPARSFANGLVAH